MLKLYHKYKKHCRRALRLRSFNYRSVKPLLVIYRYTKQQNPYTATLLTSQKKITVVIRVKMFVISRLIWMSPVLLINRVTHWVCGMKTVQN
ncbi:hypothetical protein OK016_10895 [Vibrio chagasii]|nr:hypothetical protein [Vibrio chagasii]